MLANTHRIQNLPYVSPSSDSLLSACPAPHSCLCTCLASKTLDSASIFSSLFLQFFFWCFVSVLYVSGFSWIHSPHTFSINSTSLALKLYSSASSVIFFSNSYLSV